MKHQPTINEPLKLPRAVTLFQPIPACLRTRRTFPKAEVELRWDQRPESGSQMRTRLHGSRGNGLRIRLHLTLSTEVHNTGPPETR